jgi:hypothetical protein
MSIIIAIISVLFVFALARRSLRAKSWQEGVLPWLMTAPPHNDFLPGHLPSAHADASESRADEGSHNSHDYGVSYEADASPSDTSPSCDSYDGGGGSFDSVSGRTE